MSRVCERIVAADPFDPLQRSLASWRCHHTQQVQSGTKMLSADIDSGWVPTSLPHHPLVQPNPDRSINRRRPGSRLEGDLVEGRRRASWMAVAFASWLLALFLWLSGPQRPPADAFVVKRHMQRTRRHGAMEQQKRPFVPVPRSSTGRSATAAEEGVAAPLWDAERGEWAGGRALADEEALRVPKPLYIFGWVHTPCAPSDG